jgi:hypothetical protein
VSKEPCEVATDALTATVDFLLWSPWSPETIFSPFNSVALPAHFTVENGEEVALGGPTWRKGLDERNNLVVDIILSTWLLFFGFNYVLVAFEGSVGYI